MSGHVSSRLAAHLDGQLSASEAQQIDSHLKQCDSCRREGEEIRFGMSMMDQLTPARAPDSVWASIEAALYEKRIRWYSRAPWRLAMAAALLCVIGLGIWLAGRENQWEVSMIAGGRATAERLGAHGWIETDGSSRARIVVGKIGVVEVGPNTRIGRVAALSGEHRLALEHGDISAKILAPPRLFFVDTSAGTAVDLGCEYTLHSASDGSGLLNVTRGWVSYEWQGRESLVPAGASCRTRAGFAPGTPYFDDASPEFIDALTNFDFAHGAVPGILAAARVRDTLTLWHLLTRVAPADRSLVFDRMTALSPLPADLTRERILNLDPAALNHWKEELAWTW
jgi:hypothetical protein